MILKEIFSMTDEYKANNLSLVQQLLGLTLVKKQIKKLATLIN